MNYSKEQLSRALIEVLSERVPALSDVPDHVFSPRFERKMDRLIAREAAHLKPVRHTLRKSLIAAVIVILLLFALCMSVSAVREAIFDFFLRHFDDHDDVVFEISEEKDHIETEYVITDLPEGFTLAQKNSLPHLIIWDYKNKNGDCISFSQYTADSSTFNAIDNERGQSREIEIDGQSMLLYESQKYLLLFWDFEGYLFKLEIFGKADFSKDGICKIVRSIQPIT